MIFRSDVSLIALERFFAKLEVDPCHGFEGTACVLWTGGKTCGQGKTIKYGVLKDQGKRWYVHRWAAYYHPPPRDRHAASRSSMLPAAVRRASSRR
jgi:hypothetical protein